MVGEPSVALPVSIPESPWGCAPGLRGVEPAGAVVEVMVEKERWEEWGVDRGRRCVGLREA